MSTGVGIRSAALVAEDPVDDNPTILPADLAKPAMVEAPKTTPKSPKEAPKAR